ncbi:MAG: FAD binding domain-containing protein [Bacteroidetes bacterium]|nr:FAD binding domain-containing protein [Bacteroidota bacterium]
MRGIVLAEIGPTGSLRYKAVNSCLLFLPMIHGKQLITIENLAYQKDGELILHPVQQALADHYGSQCGYCTPGMIMSMFALFKNVVDPTEEEIRTALAGNLCRCTGYRSIYQAALQACSQEGEDLFNEKEDAVLQQLYHIRQWNRAMNLKGKGQQYLLPFTLEEALSFRKAYPEAIVINGATDIAIRQNKQYEYFPFLLDLSQVDDLKIFYEDHGHWFIGAGLALEELTAISNDRIPSLYDILKVFASRQIRNAATAGGNVATASPIGDTLPWLMAMEANVHLHSESGSRVVPIEQFITGYRSTGLKEDELITLLSVPKPESGVITGCYKVSNRRDVDISNVSGVFRLTTAEGTIKKIRIVLGGMAAYPRRALKTESFLEGREWSRSTAEAAMKVLREEYQPITDARSSALARSLAAGNLLLKFWSENQHP